MADKKDEPKPQATTPTVPANTTAPSATPPPAVPAAKPDAAAAPSPSSAPAATPPAAPAKPPSPTSSSSSSDEDDDTPKFPAWMSPEAIKAAQERMAKERAQREAELQEKRKAIGPITLDTIAKGIASGKFKSIVVMAGAGISVAAGIPDFRTPGTGLYANLGKYNLPFPEAVFDIRFFRENPQPFALLAKELYPGNFAPTACHFFFRLLEKKGVLRRCYTQNIDTLERVAGVSDKALVEAHGSFGLAHCIECNKEHSVEWTKQELFADRVPRCTGCKGLVKPDIVFFGENLPRRFFELRTSDFPACDLLIVLGTSLKVQPFAGLVSAPPAWVPRLLINRESVGEGGTGFDFTAADPRDIRLLGDVQEGARTLARKIGWETDLDDLIAEWKASNPLPVTSPTPAPSTPAPTSPAAKPESAPPAAPMAAPAAPPAPQDISPAAKPQAAAAPVAVQPPAAPAAQDNTPAAKPPAAQDVTASAKPPVAAAAAAQDITAKPGSVPP